MSPLVTSVAARLEGRLGGRPARRGAARLLVLALAAGPVCVTALPAAPAHAAEGPECTQTGVDAERRPVTDTDGTDDAAAALGVPAADAIVERSGVRRPGAGVTVVVVDTPSPSLEAGATGADVSPHGLVLSSIVAGPAQPKPKVAGGIAPGARVVQRPFYDVPRGEGGQGRIEPSAANLALQLDAVAAQKKRGRLGKRTIVLTAVEVPRTAALVRAVERVVDAGALVVAAGGDRPPAQGDTAGTGGAGTDDGDLLSRFAGESARPGEDAGPVVWPAADRGVLTAGVTSVDSAVGLRSSAIDLGAPGAGSVARALNGGWCVVQAPSSHWAAAQVAGVAALVWSARPDDDAAALRRRLEATAAGSAGSSSRSFGFGEVQAVAALTRADDELSPPRQQREVVPRAIAPRPRVDRLAGVRDDAVWWGLGGGAALVVLLVLRPVLARRRTR